MLVLLFEGSKKQDLRSVTHTHYFKKRLVLCYLNIKELYIPTLHNLDV